MKAKRQQVAWRAFRSNDALEAITITPDDAQFIVGEVRRLIQRRGQWFKPTVVFISDKCGPYGCRGDACIETQRIRLFKTGHTMAVLLHEIAHLLAPQTPGQHHNKDFYAMCDLLERVLFSENGF